ncbi:hypothetical protein EPO15_10500 [bacterium]|nr:MAG: hypothetical protein EPO15_10500 [bacterium]
MSNYSTEKEDDKKGGGVPPWMTGSARVGSGLSSGGATQAGSMLARFGALLAAPKAIVAATVLGGLALGVGVVSTIQEPKQPSLSQRFNKEKVQTGSASGLPGMDQPGQSALNMAQSANSGFYGDPNASAQAPAAPEGASDAPADAPAVDAAAAGAVAGGDAAGGTPAEMAAALTGGQKTKAGMGSKFGKLSAGLGSAGGGMAGGSGLSGGIGGSFKNNLTNSRAGDLRGFQGANRAQVTRGKTASRLGGSALKGATAKRLDTMNRAMGGARTGGAEAGAASHAAQWDAATPGGSAITGGGAGGMSNGGAFSGEEGVGGGGPLGDQNSTNPNNPNDVKDIDNGKNVTQYQDQLMMAQGMLMLASAIIIVVGILAIKAKAATATVFGAGIGAALHGAAVAFMGIACGLAVAAAAIGASIGSKYGQTGQGNIIAVAGTITAAAAGAALIWPGMPAWVAVLAGIAGLAMPMMGGGGGKTQDRSDISSNG